MIEKARKIEIAKQAHDLLEISGYDFFLDGSVDVLSIAQKMGFVCAYYPQIKDNEQGLIAIDPDETTKLICLNRKCDRDMQRFVIAHELGHYVLHYRPSKKDLVYLHREQRKKGEEKPIQEQEADWFAANLMMPAAVFKKKHSFFKTRGYTGANLVLSLSQFFHVPFDSALKRIEEVI